MSEHRLYCGFIVESSWSKTALVDEDGGVRFDRLLPNHIDYILRELAPYQAQIEGIITASDRDSEWLVVGLGRAGYRVFTTGPTARALFGTGRTADAAGLAHTLVSPRLPKGEIHPAEDRSTPFACFQELFATLSNVVSRFGGAALRRALEETVNDAAHAHKLGLTATGGIIEGDPYELTAPLCRELVAACVTHAMESVGRKTVVADLEELDRRRQKDGRPSLTDTLGLADVLA